MVSVLFCARTRRTYIASGQAAVLYDIENEAVVLGEAGSVRLRWPGLADADHGLVAVFEQGRMMDNSGIRDWFGHSSWI